MDSSTSSGDESERDYPTEEQHDVLDDNSAANISPTGTEPPEGGDRRAQSSTHKRRRVTRACDECRRKKIKCDGKQPCTHCTVYSYECTYDQPSYRRKNPAPQYIAALESKLARAEAVLRAYLPNLDWNDPSLDAILERQGSLPNASLSQFGSNSAGDAIAKGSSADSKLELMVEATGKLELDREGYWDYHGHSSGLSFIAGMREQLGDLNGQREAEERTNPRLKCQKPEIRIPSPQNFGRSISSPLESNDTSTDELPDKARAKELCARALEDATAILQVVHQPSFYRSLNRIYDLPIEQYSDHEQKFLPLLYAVIALGCLFDADEHSVLEVKGYKSATGLGYKYFSAARNLMDITDCRELVSLQAIIFMILFLQCSAKLATCYSYIGVALRSALRMGLHRSFRDSFSPIESECRKRAFWVIRKMDVYVGAMLGLPQTLNDDDIDQEYPVDIDDENITDEGIKPMPQGQISEMTASNANFRLTKIMTKIVRHVYPIKGFQIQEHQTPGSYTVSYTVIKELEMDLQRWHESLPPELIPSEDNTNPPPLKRLRQQQLLRMAYGHAQMILYRPFLHYVSSKSKSKPIGARCHTCAAACVSVSHNITHLTSEMSQRGLLKGSYWFVMYTAFFAILSLVFFALENPELEASQDALRDAKEGTETMERLARRCMAADRCSTTLNSLFEQIAPVLERGKLSAKTISQKGESTRRDLSPRTYSALMPEETKGKTIRLSSNGSANPPRGNSGSSGNSGGRQRGMRLIPHTGRPNQPKSQQQQQQQRTQSRPLAKPTSPTSQSQFPIHLHKRKSDFGVAPTTPVTTYGMKVESPDTPSNASQYGMTAHHHHQHHQQQLQQQDQDQDFYAQQSQQFSYLPTQFPDMPYTANISNVSNMMFPSDNPFQYPNQPVTMLEQQNYTAPGYPQAAHPSQTAHTSPHSHEMFIPASTSGAHNVSVDDHIDVQLFGPIPPYTNMHDNSPSHDDGHHHTSTAANLNIYNTSAAAASSSPAEYGRDMHQGGLPHPPTGPEMWNQQVRSHGLPGMDLDDFFAGDEWPQLHQQ